MSDAPRNIRNILIVGGTLAGWMTAAALARALPAGRYAIGLVEADERPDELDTVGGLASLPLLRGFHGQIGLDEKDLVGQSGAEFSLGAEFAGWSSPTSSYFRPFSATGAKLGGVAFHNLWLRLRRSGGAGELDEYALGAVAGRLGRFAFPTTDPGSILSTLDYGYHLDGVAYRDLLRFMAERQGVKRVRGMVGAVELRGQDGFIEAVKLTDGERIAADFFIDCTGAPARLLGEALGIGFDDWRRWLPCDRVVAGRAAKPPAPLPYARAIAGAAGWQWRLPLRNGLDVGHVYASAQLDDEDAAAILPDMKDAKALPFASGRRDRFWERNCVAIGASACVLDPVEPSALAAIQRAILTFLELMPFRHDEAGEAEEYNRIMIETVERMRDLAILHFKANGRRDSAFWTGCRDMELPEILAYKLRLFEAKGRVLELDEEVFEPSDWAAVYLGQGIEPRSYDRLADVPDRAMVRDTFAGMRKAMRAAAEAMPSFESLRRAGAP